MFCLVEWFFYVHFLENNITPKITKYNSGHYRAPVKKHMACHSQHQQFRAVRLSSMWASGVVARAHLVLGAHPTRLGVSLLAPRVLGDMLGSRVSLLVSLRLVSFGCIIPSMNSGVVTQVHGGYSWILWIFFWAN
jgi:hypothetical protein